MPLTVCPTCKSAVSASATGCPKCGEPDPSRRRRNRTRAARIAGAAIFIASALYFWFVALPNLQDVLHKV